jgi:formylglycine-generating enzyme required for sulfatase activity
MSGLPAGGIAYFLSFNHDTERFEIIASGHVQDDSATIVTDPGAGLSIAGWGCNCPPYAVTGECKKCPPMQNGCGAANSSVFTPQALNCFNIYSLNGVKRVCFEPACNNHDSCWGTCGASQLQCDLIFYSEMSRICLQSDLDPSELIVCLNIAAIYAGVTSGIGGGILGNFDEAQKAGCECDRMNGQARAMFIGDFLRAMGVPSPPAVEDADGDGLPDSWEIQVGLNPQDKNDARIDSEGDGLINLLEYVHGLHPFNPDTRGEGRGDLNEVRRIQPPSQPMLDQRWTVSVNGQAVAPTPFGSFVLRNVSAADLFGPNGPGTAPDFLSDDFVRLTGSATINGLTRYVFSEPFQMRQAQSIQVDQLTFTDFPPPLPESIRAVPDNPTLTALGQTTQVRVTATLHDGSSVDATPRTRWTVYRTSNPSVATVDQNGLVTARARGLVYVTAVNEGASAVVQLAVSPGDALTTVVGVLRDTNGVPVAGATVTAGALGMSGLTDADGRFVIAGVPSGLGSLTVTAVLLRGTNLPLVAVSALLTPVPGGTTDAGVLVARPGWPGMVLIPAGSFTMGNTFPGEGFSEELPLHTNQISAFLMDQYEVTKAQWDEVYNWAITHGYSFEFGAQGKASDHPAHSIRWYDAVKWCNARSEQAGLTPAYYTSAAQTNVYRSGQVNVQNGWVKWTGGFRLPTEAEWEKAARGGASGRRFPWADADTITHSRVNYYSSSSYAYDVSPTRNHHPTFAVGGFPYTSPAGYFAPNGYGLYDMAGNVFEWCWDWYGSYSSVAQTDPRGPTSGSYRVLRGGSWFHYAVGCRAANRGFNSPAGRINYLGFRSVLPPGQP